MTAEVKMMNGKRSQVQTIIGNFRTITHLQLFEKDEKYFVLSNAETDFLKL